jgi:hypothetical protein
MELGLETILGIVMITIGIISFLFVMNAKNKFPVNSELKTITTDLIPAIFFLMLFSLWHVLREVFHWKKTIGEFMEYPEYLFISIAYIMLFIAAKKLHSIAKEFGITEK